MNKWYIIILFICSLLILQGCNNQKYSNSDKEEVKIQDNIEELEYWMIAKEKEIIEDVSDTTISTQQLESKIENLAITVSSTVDETVKISVSRNITDEQKNEILDNIDDIQAIDTESISALMNLIDKNIASFEQRERDLMVKKYMLSQYAIMNNLNGILEAIGYDLEAAISTYNINVNDKSSVLTLPDAYGTVRGFLLEVKDKGFFINSKGENEGFYIDLDLGNMMDKYNDYISPSVRSYMEFNNYEINNVLFDYDIKEISERIKMLEEGMKKDKEYNYVMSDKYVTSLVYYYQLFLGLSHNEFVNKDNRFKTEILKQYQELECSETTKDILEKMILAIEANNGFYDENLKELVFDYMNGKIYTDELTSVLENKETYVLKIISKEESITSEKFDEYKSNILQEKIFLD